MIRKMLTIAAAILVVLGCGALVGFTLESESNARFTALDVDVEEVNGVFFVDAAAVKAAILENDSITGSFVEDVALADVAKWVHGIPAVDEVRVYPGLNRTLHVHVTQRKPLARLHISADTPDQYLDENGALLPLSSHYTARVPVIHAASAEAAAPGFKLVEATHEHALWSAFIDQIEVKPKGALVVIPRVGGARIHFDSLDDLEGKLNKLEVFYREQIARGNLNAYKTIDLAYKDQVVAQRYY
jgi:cell division protein FtsQ